jgi:hypothetical protein
MINFETLLLMQSIIKIENKQSRERLVAQSLETAEGRNALAIAMTNNLPQELMNNIIRNGI